MPRKRPVQKAAKPEQAKDPLTGSPVPIPNVPSMMGVQQDWAGQILKPEEGSPARRITIGNEYGVPGIKHWFGRLYEEFLPDLADEKGRKVFVEMAWNEPAIASFRYAIEMLIRQIQWQVEPYDESPEETEWAEFIDSCYHDMDQPWDAVISDALTMIIYGWCLQEMVFKKRSGREGSPPSNHTDGKIGWARMAPRHQETIWRWELDTHGRVTGAIQWAPPAYQFTRLPGETLLHFKTHEWHASPEGVSMLRGAYVPYSFKKTVQITEAIAIERTGCGVPVFRMPAERFRLASENSAEGVQAQQEIDEFKRTARDMKVDEQMGLVLPLEYDEKGNELYKFSFESPPASSGIDTDTTIRRYKEEMLSAVLADFLAFGHETTGTQALGSTRNELFLTGVNAVAKAICGPHNRIAIPLLCELNGKKDKFPTLGHSDLKEENLSVLGPFLGVLAQIGLPLNDPQTERHLRRVAGIPIPEIEGNR